MNALPIKDQVAGWIRRTRPGTFVYRDRYTCFDHAWRSFCASEGRMVQAGVFEKALVDLGYAIEPHPGGYRLVLDWGPV